MLVIAACVTVLVVAAAAQAIRMGVTRGDWAAVWMILGLLIATGAVYWLVRLTNTPT